MLVLGIDTSTLAGSVALINEREILAEYLINSTNNHGERLLKGIDLILEETEKTVQECGAIGVSIGPGSFTGVRIGVSTAKTLAYLLQKPIIGLSSLEVLANNLPLASSFICPMLDAKKNEVYTALYQWLDGELKPLIPEGVISPLDMLGQVKGYSPIVFLGNGANAYSGIIQKEYGEEAAFALSCHNVPRASVVAALALKRLIKNQCDSAKDLVPRYLRLPDAEINRAKKHE